MFFYRKKYIDKIKNLIDNNNALILVGARQVGKSSILSILKQENIITDTIFLSGDDYSLDDYSPESFLNLIELENNLENIKFVVIDEAQKIKNIGIIIKYLVDKKKDSQLNFKTIISGSGSLEIFRGITDSLIGRYNLIRINPFSFEEFLEFNGLNLAKISLKNIEPIIIKKIEQYFGLYMKFGGYPEVVKAKTIDEKKKVFKMIYDDYIYKDIGYLLTNDEIVNFEKFLKLFVSKIGTLIKVENLARELGIKKSLFDKFLLILKSSFLFDFIKPFSSNLTTEVRKSNKGYMLDIGFINYILGVTANFGDFKGKIVENFVHNELNFIKKDFEEIKFWQNNNGSEVDFLLIDNFDKKIVPIEVKSGTRDIIPKALISFISKYQSNINKSYITTKDFYKVRKQDENEYYFVPYSLIGKIKE